MSGLALKEEGIPTAVHYPHPLHRQPALAGVPEPDVPATDKASDEVLSLPMHPYLTLRGPGAQSRAAFGPHSPDPLSLPTCKNPD
jgi:UDP-2-acetamido-2-deoxy-ribo-hexuluronate aminotransferase